MLDKIGIDWSFNDDEWEGYYHLTDNIIDAIRLLEEERIRD